jgi:hypothetical protein
MSRIIVFELYCLTGECPIPLKRDLNFPPSLIPTETGNNAKTEKRDSRKLAKWFELIVPLIMGMPTSSGPAAKLIFER